MNASNFELIEQHGGVPIKMFTQGVPVEDEARRQLMGLARLPVVGPFVAAMPDVHLGIGATVGSVVPTRGAIIPAAVGVDIGCGMIAARTSLVAADLPDNLGPLRSAIERAVPHGRSKGARDKAIAGGALLLLGLLTSTAADVRHWATLPDTVQVLTLDVPPGDHDLHLAFFDRNGAHLGALDQDWKVSVPEGSESFYLFRSLPGLDRIVPTASEPAAAPTEKKLP